MNEEARKLVELLRDEDNCNVLDYIDDAADLIESLSAQLDQVTQERDEAWKIVESLSNQTEAMSEVIEKMKRKLNAAVEDLSAHRPCDACGHEPQEDACVRCRSYTERPYWKWRGVEVE